MKVIYNKYLPFGSFFALNLFGVIFCRSDKGRLSDVDRNHEYIHTLQQREMLFIGFYVWYCMEWLYRSIRLRSWMKGYYAISFEREAYIMQHDLDYPNHRRHFAWWKLFTFHLK